MKTLTITREKFETLQEEHSCAVAEGNGPLAQFVTLDMKDVIAEVHAEALEINHRRRVAEFFGGLDYEARKASVDTAHSEALEINQCFDFNVQQVKLGAEHQRAVLERLA